MTTCSVQPSVTCGVRSVVDAGVAAAVLARAAAVAVRGAAEVGGVRVTRSAVKLRAAPPVLSHSARTARHNLQSGYSNIFVYILFLNIFAARKYF